MDRKIEAITLFENGFNCSQAVLGAFTQDLSIDKKTALKIGTGFGGGARNGELCGAVTGGLMVLGLKDGHFTKDDQAGKLRSYELAKEFTERFGQAQGDIVCKNLLGYDLSNPEEYKILEDKGSFKTECPKYIETAVEILEEMIQW